MIARPVVFSRFLQVLLAAPMLLTLTATARPLRADEIVGVEIRNLSDAALANAAITFGQAFKQGDVPRGKHVQCPVGDGWAQIDPKCTYDDGSLRFAVVSAVLPELPAAGSTTLRLTSSDAASSPLASCGTFISYAISFSSPGPISNSTGSILNHESSGMSIFSSAMCQSLGLTRMCCGALDTFWTLNFP